jgi:hypothetical protein
MLDFILIVLVFFGLSFSFVLIIVIRGKEAIIPYGETEFQPEDKVLALFQCASGQTSGRCCDFSHR